MDSDKSEVQLIVLLCFLLLLLALLCRQLGLVLLQDLCQRLSCQRHELGPQLELRVEFFDQTRCCNVTSMNEFKI